MDQTNDVIARCEDHLRGNPHVYAHKARRKKIALIRVELRNQGSDSVRLDLSNAELEAGARFVSVVSPERILRRFSEFTWDFLLFAVLDFHPILIAADLFFLICGPLYNRRLKRQLSELTNSAIELQPGESRTVLLGFEASGEAPTSLKIPMQSDGQGRQLLRSDIGGTG